MKALEKDFWCASLKVILLTSFYNFIFHTIMMDAAMQLESFSTGLITFVTLKIIKVLQDFK